MNVFSQNLWTLDNNCCMLVKLPWQVYHNNNIKQLAYNQLL